MQTIDLYRYKIYSLLLTIFFYISDMRNPSANIPPAKYVTGHLHRFVDLNSLQLHPHSLIDTPNPTRDESVEAKWEQIQHYEAARENPSLSSLASSTASNSTSSTTSNDRYCSGNLIPVI